MISVSCFVSKTKSTFFQCESSSSERGWDTNSYPAREEQDEVQQHDEAAQSGVEQDLGGDSRGNDEDED